MVQGEQVAKPAFPGRFFFFLPARAAQRTRLLSAFQSIHLFWLEREMPVNPGWSFVSLGILQTEDRNPGAGRADALPGCSVVEALSTTATWPCVYLPRPIPREPSDDDGSRFLSPRDVVAGAAEGSRRRREATSRPAKRRWLCGGYAARNGNGEGGLPMMG